MAQAVLSVTYSERMLLVWRGAARVLDARRRGSSCASLCELSSPNHALSATPAHACAALWWTSRVTVWLYLYLL